MYSPTTFTKIFLQKVDIACLRWHAGSAWGAGATMLRTATLALVH